VTQIEIRARNLEDDPAILEIRNEAADPFPPMTLEEYRYNADPANSPPGAVQERYVAILDGRAVGIYVVADAFFLDRPHTFTANIGVGAANRRRGIGSRLYDHMLERVKAHEGNRIYCFISEAESEAVQFAKNRGFTTTGRANRMSRLDVEKANLDNGYQGIVERLEAEGIMFRTISEVGMENEPVLRAIHAMAYESARDIPSSEEFSAIPFEVWQKWITSPGNSPDQGWVAFDGDRPVGIAVLSRRGKDGGFNNYTGVDREYRGRGIARALKVKTLDWSRANGVRWIFTGNDVDNSRMLAINVRLGYEPLPMEVEMVKDL